MADAKDPRLDELQARREFNEGKQIDNSTLYAGSPMYYYCQTCGAHVSTKPEGWWQDPPPKHCAPCKDLLADGVISHDDLFSDWERKRKEAAV
jgi:hypothetical protein